MAILHEDPYRLTEVDGVGFARADKIALAADVPPESSRRAQAAAVFALAEAEQQGNSYLPLDELTARTARLIGLAADPEVLVEAARPAGRRRHRVYRELTHASELAVAKTLARRLAAAPHLDHDPGETPREQLTDEQWAAVRGAFASRVSVLTGGPGVGKTVCTREIVAEAEAADATIALCAPTGRAARRLEEATGHEAQTIHRMLEWMPGREPTFRPGHPLPVDLVDRRRVLDAEPAPGRGAARRPRRDDPRRPRRRRRPAAADRRRQAVRGPDRLRRGAGRPAQPDLPPGGALDDHHRRPRDQPGTPAPPRARRRPGPRLLLHRPPQPRAGAGDGGRGGRRAGAEAASRSTRSARSRCWRRCTGARSGSTPSTSACRRASTPTARRR